MNFLSASSKFRSFLNPIVTTVRVSGCLRSVFPTVPIVCFVEEGCSWHVFTGFAVSFEDATQRISEVSMHV